MPKFAVTVPQSLYDEVARAHGEPFADSYLHGAIVTNQALVPRTQTAWDRLKSDWTCGQIFQREGIRLVKPEPFRVAG